MNKAKMFFSSTLMVVVSLWLCLLMLTMPAMMLGSAFFTSGRSHAHNAEIAMMWGDKDVAVEELEKSAKDGLVGHHIAVGVYTAGQILLPFMWDDFKELRTNSFEDIANLKNDLAVGYGK